MTVADIAKLSLREKLQLMEAIWEDLRGRVDAMESPAWHAEELRKTETALAAGQIEVLDWQEAKKELRARFE